MRFTLINTKTRTGVKSSAAGAWFSSASFNKCIIAEQHRRAAWSFPRGERKAARALTSRWADGQGHSRMYFGLICKAGWFGVTTAERRAICSLKSLK